MVFKLVCYVEDSLSLGSILMTNGVSVVSVDTISSDKIKKENIVLLPKKTRTFQGRFNHPSRKTASDFVLEFMKNNNGNGKYADMKNYLITEGFSKSTINNAIIRLIKNHIITRTDYGRYAIRRKSRSSS